MKFLRSLFRRRTLAEIAQKELDEARLAQLEAQTGREYADSVVIYRLNQIRRLEKMLCGDAQS